MSNAILDDAYVNGSSNDSYATPSSAVSTESIATTALRLRELQSSVSASTSFAAIADLIPLSDRSSIFSTDAAKRPLSFSRLVNFVKAMDLSRFGLQRESVVCTAIPNGPEAAVCFWALASQCVFAPLNPKLTVPEIEFELYDLPAAAMILMQGDASVSMVEECCNVNGVRVLHMEPDLSIAGLFTLTGPTVVCAPTTATKASDIALVLHTSGTTKKPKIVPLTHHNIGHGIQFVAKTLRRREEHVNLNVMPLFHIHGLIANVGVSVYSQAQIVCASFNGGADFLQRLSDPTHPTPTWYSAVPTMHEAILLQAEARGSALQHSLEMMRNCSAALLPPVSQRFIDAFGTTAPGPFAVIPTYAMTESFPICSNPPHLEVKLATVGPALGPSIEILKCHPDDSAVERGVEGEVCVTGECVTAGYLIREHMASDPNIEAYSLPSSTVGRMLRTGDKGYLDGDGYLQLVGRFKEIINCGGEKISPLELEDQLLSVTAVQTCVCFAAPAELYGEVVGVACVTKAGHEPPTIDAIRAGIKESGQRFKPQVLVHMDAIPKGPTGKPMRIGLAKMLKLPTVIDSKGMPTYTIHGTGNDLGTLVLHEKPILLRESQVIGDLITSLPEVQAMVLRITMEAHGDNGLDLDAPFMDVGIDSISAPELASRMEHALHLPLSPTLIFEHPTPRAVASHVAQRTLGRALTSTPESHLPLASRRSSRALQCDSCCQRWADTLSASRLQSLFHSSGDAIVQVPLTRWSAQDVHADVGGQSCPMGVQYGSFLARADMFDNVAFRISDFEASAMDPQQRLLLEVGYRALHLASHRRASLANTDTAVVLGVERPDWPILVAQIPSRGLSAFTATADAVSVAGGRLSFVLGLHGLNVSLDTACSSALAAAHVAATTLYGAECSSALVESVNLTLAVQISIMYSTAGMLSADGRCKTMDASANGYVRSEGIASFFIGDGNGTDISLSSTAVRQDGRSASLTAPNASSQRILLRAAQLTAGIMASRVQRIETHGTGTALGDPTEAAAIGAELTELARPIALGATKSNLGHGEAAAGMLGLAAAIREANRANAIAHLARVNPLVSACLPSPCIYLPAQQLLVPGSSLGVGTSAFGYSGTIAHAIIQCGFGAALKRSWLSQVYTLRRRSFPWRERVNQYLDLSDYTNGWTLSSAAVSIQPARWYGLAITADALGNGTQQFERDGVHATFSNGAGWRAVAVLLTGGASGAPCLQGMHLAMIALLYATCTRSCQDACVMVFTCTHLASLLVSSSSAVSTAHSGAWGVGRVARIEHPSLRTLNVDKLGGKSLAQLMTLAVAEAGEREVACDIIGCLSFPRLRRAVALQSTSYYRRSLAGGGSYMITGGLGGLGLRAASLLVANGAQHVTLTSRSGRVVRGGQGLDLLLQHVLAFPLAVTEVVMADASDSAYFEALLWHSMVRLGSIGGVLHAAGILDRDLLVNVTSGNLNLSLASKALAMSSIYYATSAVNLEVLLMFSSIASLLGYAGQGTYAAANACLDEYALTSRALGRVSSGLNLPLVAKIGLGAATFGEVIFGSVTAMHPEQYALWVQTKLARFSSIGCNLAALPSASDALMLRVADASQTRFLELKSATPALRTETCRAGPRASNRGPASPPTRVSSDFSNEHACALVLRLVCELTGVPKDSNDADTPLMDAGLDSIAATTLSSRLQVISGTALSPTLAFEHPTPRAVATHLMMQARPDLSTSAETVYLAASVHLSAPPELLSLAARFPGGCGSDWMYHQLQVANGNAIMRVPAVRWTLELVDDIKAFTAAQRTCSRYGGFVSQAQLFDNHSFGLSILEAGSMDPHQRMLLEISYAAFHSAGQRKALLAGCELPVLLGIERSDWMLSQLPRTKSSVYEVSSTHESVASGRISFTLGLQGVCMSINAACASTLVAVHAAKCFPHAQSYNKDGSMAAALGASLKLHPASTLAIAAAGMLSVDGRCKTLDKRANGYVRSECIGALTLQCGRSSREALLMLQGTAVRHDGRSASLTAPNGSVQRALMLDGLRATGVSASYIGAMEAHGTGTALGDPTETTALAAVHNSGLRLTPLVVGAAKATIGHSEAPSGLAGLAEVHLLLKSATTVGNAHLVTLNPLVLRSVSVAPVLLNTQGNVAACSEGACGINSFGFSGTIAHAILVNHEPRNGSMQVVAYLGFRRRAFESSQHPHPLRQISLRESSNEVIARCVALERVHALISNHVVQSQVIFPAVGYLEMARSALGVFPNTTPTLELAHDARLQNVFFLMPLSIDPSDSFELACIATAHTFEVRRCDPGSDLGDGSPAVHCRGDAVPFASSAWPISWPSGRASSSLVTSPAEIYDEYHAAQLRYGPSFRMLERTWIGDQGIRAVAMLRRRATRQGTHVHPGDLDGAWQLSQRLTRDVPVPRSNITRLPFAVDETLLKGHAGRLWAAAQSKGQDTFDVYLGGAEGCVAQTQKLRLRELRELSTVACPPQSPQFLAMPHPMLQSYQATARNTCFRASVTHALYSLIEGHLPVNTSVALFPAAGFLEMASAACCTVLSLQVGDWSLAQHIQLLRPLVIDGPQSNQSIECSIDEKGAFQVGCSLHPASNGDDDLLEVCMQAAHVVQSLGCSSNVAINSIRQDCNTAADVHEQSSGLELAPYYDVFIGKLWTNADTILCDVSARKDLCGMGVHPADLHAVVHLSALMFYSAGDSAPLPYAIDASELPMRCSMDPLVAYTYRQGELRCTGSLVDATSEMPTAHVQGLSLRSARVALAVPASRDTYILCWHSLSAYTHAASSSIKLVLIGPTLVNKTSRQPHFQGVVSRYPIVGMLHVDAHSCQQVRRVMIEAVLCAIQCVTSSAERSQLIVITNAQRSADAGSWGVVRCARQEAPLVQLSCVEGTPTVHGVKLHVIDANENEFQVSPGWFYPRLNRVPVTALPAQSAGLHGLLSQIHRRDRMKNALCAASSSHLIVGGTRGLGLLTARWLAQIGASGLILASRDGLAPSAELASMGLQSANPYTAVCDAANEKDVVALQSRAVAVHGWWHTAGTVADRLLGLHGHESLRAVYAPKYVGALHLHHAFERREPLKACILFSSATGLLGNGGQANYGAANCSLDSLALRRRALGIAALSIQWGPWAGAGMASSATVTGRLIGQGYHLLGPSQGLAALQAALVHQCPLIGVMVISWSRMAHATNGPLNIVSRLSGPLATAQLNLVPSSEVVKLAASPLEMVLCAVQRTAGSAAVGVDSPLMEAGIDSLGAVELRNHLQGLLEGVSLPTTLIFDHPTVAQLTALVNSFAAPSSNLDCCDAMLTTRVSPEAGGACHALVPAACGFSALMPGNVLSTHEASAMTSCGANVMTEVPLSRWDVNTLPPAVPAVASRRRYLGVVSLAERFDTHIFHVADAEAAAMDPQQRLLLERGYESLHDAGFNQASLHGSLTAVFVGIDCHDFAIVLNSAPAGSSVYAATGSAQAVACGRLSYVLGLHGPSATLRTACSSALVALHVALQACSSDGCASALAAGVHVMLLPEWSSCYATAGMLSMTGRCYTFDVRADGYARSEAVGALAMQLGGATPILGSAVRQDGRSASLTAPNGLAQRDLLLRAFTCAYATTPDLGVCEAHGTGTGLGDPVEVSSLAFVALKAANPASIPLSGIKGNCGHSEPAAGMAGLLKLLKQVHAGSTASNAQLRQMNPHLSSANSGLFWPVQLMPAYGAAKRDLRSIAGVSSFGFGGTIAHALVDGSTASSKATACAQLPLSFKRYTFTWRVAVHPFVQQRVLMHDGDDSVFRSPVAGVLLTMVEEHVVQGRVVFPGAGYLELVHATSCTVSSTIVSSFSNAFFLQPLLLETPELVVECSIAGGGAFEVCSGQLSATASMVDRVTHSSGIVRTIAPCLVAADPAKASGQHSRAVDALALYNSFHFIGLHYGPVYRVSTQLWSSADGEKALSRLHSRQECHGTRIHPAELDGALQLCSLISQRMSSGEAWLPFALDCALLRSSQGFGLWATVAQQSDDASSVGISDSRLSACVRIDNFKMRKLKASLQLVVQSLRWHYEVEWGPAIDAQSSTEKGVLMSELRVLAFGIVPGTILAALRGSSLERMSNISPPTLENCRWNAAIFMASSSHSPTSSWTELHAMSLALALAQAQLAAAPKLPVWIYTRGTQVAGANSIPSHAGLWGLNRACRQELHSLPAWSVDLQSDTSKAACRVKGALSSGSVQLMHGVVRGLQTRSSTEPEAVLHATQFLVPRLVQPHRGATSCGHPPRFEDICHAIMLCASASMRKLSMPSLGEAQLQLEVLCQRYVHDSTRLGDGLSACAWHHQLLYAWCSTCSPPPADHTTITPAELSAAWVAVGAEANLVERCGPQLRQALMGTVPYQELLFPGGSLDAVRPVYEDRVHSVFYNGCVVAAVEAVVSLSDCEQHVVVLEVGAGTGGTSSSVLPVLDGACKRYVFTDVSDIFLRQAQVRFAQYVFVEYTLLNIDADPRLQGVASQQHDIVIATNVLHATPFMRNTMQHCHQLLRDCGTLVVNEALYTESFVQITFGLTSGWWLFTESRDPERVGQDSPLLSWRQWDSLLAQCGFEQRQCVQGKGFLSSQAVMVARICEETKVAPPSVLGSGVYLISGGLGGLGLMAARGLIQSGATQIVLSSRTNRVQAGSEADWAWIANSSVAVHRIRCNVSDDRDVVQATLSLLVNHHLLSGIFHAAHQLADATLSNQEARNFRTTYGPKVHGACALHVCSASTPLNFFNLFSSLAGLMGSAGQAPHSAANAWLDSMAAFRRSRAVRSQSVAWGAVAEVGYAARHGADVRAEASGLGAITRAVVCSALSCMLQLERRSFVVLPADWSKMLRSGNSESGGFLAPYSHLRAKANQPPTKSSQQSCAPDGSTDDNTVDLEAVRELMQHIAGGKVEADTPLMEAGIDSLGAVELRTQLQRIAGNNVSLPSTVVFDHPTARQLSSLFEAGKQDDRTNTGSPSQQQYMLMASSRASILGVAILLPAGPCSPREAHHAIRCGYNGVGQVPTARWQLGADQAWPDPIAQRVSHGGFVRGAQLVDNAAFNISSAEAACMDPQQRLLLERGYVAFHQAAMHRSGLLGSLTGVYLGTPSADFNEVLAKFPNGGGVYKATGATLSIASGRLSYVLGLQGPCISYDTACSAALTAGHGGLRAVQSAECTIGLVAGVSLMLVPGMSVAFAVAGMTSLKGQSSTFDAGADGYARAEACGAVAMESGTPATDTTLCMAGGAVRQDGRSASLTAPNGLAQQSLILAALVDSSQSPSMLYVNEAHGTGTVLGDPIEAGALAATVLTHRCAEKPLLLGGTKANLGHAEPAAGMTGLLALSSQLSACEAVPNAQLRQMNVHVHSALASVACALSVNLGIVEGGSTSWGGVSSFGFSGTIVHMLCATTSSTVRLPCSSAWPLKLHSFPIILHTQGETPSTSFYMTCWASHNTDPSMLNAKHFVMHCTLPRSVVVPDGMPQRGWGFFQCVLALNYSSLTDAPSMDGTHMLLYLCQCIVKQSCMSKLLLIAPCMGAATHSSAAGHRSIAHGGWWGHGRALRLEHPSMSVRIFAASPGGGMCSTSIMKALVSLHQEVADGSQEVWLDSHQQRVARLRQASRMCATQHSVGYCGSHLITGGLGALGIQTAISLLQNGAIGVILASRSGRSRREEQHRLAQLLATHGTCRHFAMACDVSDGTELLSLCGLAGKSPFQGVLHASGTLVDRLMATATYDSAKAVFAPKAVAAFHLCQATSAQPLSTCLFFSSIVVLFGNIGQVNYASANAYLDVLAYCRCNAAYLVQSVQLPLVTGSGMGHESLKAITSSHAAASLSFAISLDQYAQVLLAGLTGSMYLNNTVAALPASWSRSGGAFWQHSTFAELQRPVPVQPVIGVVPTYLGVHALAQSIVPGTVLDADTQLLDAGVDSIGAIELRNQLQLAVGSSSLPATIIFDHPTVRRLQNACSSNGVVSTPPHCKVKLLVPPHPRSHPTSHDQHCEILPKMLDTHAPHEGPHIKPQSGAQALAPATTLAVDARRNEEKVYQISGGPLHKEELPQPVPDQVLGSERSGDRRRRILMLHGDAANGRLLEMMMGGTGWLGMNVDFVFPDAPHSCQPRPSLYRQLTDIGLYGGDDMQYFSWQVSNLQGCELSIRYLEQLLNVASPAFDGVGGICDGSLTAAALAALHPTLRLYVNICGPPLKRLPAPLLRRLEPQSVPIQMPSLHLLGEADELFSMSELRSISAICHVPNIIVHRQGHQVPLMNKEIAAAFVTTTDESHTVHVDSFRFIPQETVVVAQAQDSMDFAVKARVATEQDLAISNIYAVATICVAYFHWAFHASPTGALDWAKIRTAMESIVPSVYATKIEDQALLDVMNIFVLLNGVLDHRRGLSWSSFVGFAKVSMLLTFVFFCTPLPSNLHDAFVESAGDCETLMTVASPVWFLFSLTIVKFIVQVGSNACKLMSSTREPLVLPIFSAVIHFVCFSDRLPWPFVREPLNAVPFAPGGLRLIKWFPRTNHQVTTFIVWYSLAPALLPKSFPATLPGEQPSQRSRGANIAIRLLWASSLWLGLLVPKPNLNAFSLPYAALPCAHGARVQGNGCAIATLQLLKQDSVLEQWKLSSFLQDAYAMLLMLATMCGVLAWAPRRRVVLLTTIGEHGLLCYLLAPLLHYFFSPWLEHLIVMVMARVQPLAHFIEGITNIPVEKWIAQPPLTFTWVVIPCFSMGFWFLSRAVRAATQLQLSQLLSVSKVSVSPALVVLFAAAVYNPRPAQCEEIHLNNLLREQADDLLKSIEARNITLTSVGQSRTLPSCRETPHPMDGSLCSSCVLSLHSCQRCEEIMFDCACTAACTAANSNTQQSAEVLIPMHLLQTRERASEETQARWQSANPGLSYLSMNVAQGRTYLSQTWGSAYATAYDALGLDSTKLTFLGVCYLADRGGFYAHSRMCPGPLLLNAVRSSWAQLVLPITFDRQGLPTVSERFFGAAPRHPAMLLAAQIAMERIHERFLPQDVDPRDIASSLSGMATLTDFIWAETTLPLATNVQETWKRAPVCQHFDQLLAAVGAGTTDKSQHGVAGTTRQELRDDHLSRLSVHSGYYARACQSPSGGMWLFQNERAAPARTLPLSRSLFGRGPVTYLSKASKNLPKASASSNFLMNNSLQAPIAVQCAAARSPSNRSVDIALLKRAHRGDSLYTGCKVEWRHGIPNTNRGTTNQSRKHSREACRLSSMVAAVHRARNAKWEALDMLARAPMRCTGLLRCRNRDPPDSKSAEDHASSHVKRGVGLVNEPCHGCPHPKRGVVDAFACLTMCNFQEGCTGWVHNADGDCYLKGGKIPQWQSEDSKDNSTKSKDFNSTVKSITTAAWTGARSRAPVSSQILQRLAVVSDTLPVALAFSLRRGQPLVRHVHRGFNLQNKACANCPHPKEGVTDVFSCVMLCIAESACDCWVHNSLGECYLKRGKPAYVRMDKQAVLTSAGSRHTRPSGRTQAQPSHSRASHVQGGVSVIQSSPSLMGASEVLQLTLERHHMHSLMIDPGPRNVRRGYTLTNEPCEGCPHPKRNVHDAFVCLSLCAEVEGCRGWVYDSSRDCYLKGGRMSLWRQHAPLSYAGWLTSAAGSFSWSKVQANSDGPKKNASFGDALGTSRSRSVEKRCAHFRDMLLRKKRPEQAGRIYKKCMDGINSGQTDRARQHHRQVNP